MKRSPEVDKPKNFLRKIAGDVIAAKSMKKSGQLPKDFMTNLEVNPALLGNVHVFDSLLGMDQVEVLLAKSGIKMNQELSSFMKNLNFMGKKEALKLTNFPEFHIELNKNYEEQFWAQALENKDKKYEGYNPWNESTKTKNQLLYEDLPQDSNGKAKAPNFMDSITGFVTETKFMVNDSWLKKSVKNFDVMQKQMTELAVMSQEDQSSKIFEMMQKGIITPNFSEKALIEIDSQIAKLAKLNDLTEEEKVQLAAKTLGWSKERLAAFHEDTDVEEKTQQVHTGLFLNVFGKSLRKEIKKTHIKEDEKETPTAEDFLFDSKGPEPENIPPRMMKKYYKEKMFLIEQRIIEELKEPKRMDMLMNVWQQRTSEENAIEKFQDSYLNRADHENPQHIEKQRQFYMAALSGLQANKITTDKFHNFFAEYYNRLEPSLTFVSTNGDPGASKLRNIKFFRDGFDNPEKTEQMMIMWDKENRPLVTDDKHPLPQLENMVNYILTTIKNPNYFYKLMNEIDQDEIVQTPVKAQTPKKKGGEFKVVNVDDKSNKMILSNELGNALTMLFGNEKYGIFSKYNPMMVYPKPNMRLEEFQEPMKKGKHNPKDVPEEVKNIVSKDELEEVAQEMRKGGSLSEQAQDVVHRVTDPYYSTSDYQNKLIYRKMILSNKIMQLLEWRETVVVKTYMDYNTLDHITSDFLSQNKSRLEELESSGWSAEEAVVQVLREPRVSTDNFVIEKSKDKKLKEVFTVESKEEVEQMLEQEKKRLRYLSVLKDSHLMNKIRKHQQTSKGKFVSHDGDFGEPKKQNKFIQSKSTRKVPPPSPKNDQNISQEMTLLKELGIDKALNMRERGFSEVLNEVLDCLKTKEERVAHPADFETFLEKENTNRTLLDSFFQFTEVEMAKKKVLFTLQQNISRVKTFDQFIQQDKQARGVKAVPDDFYQFTHKERVHLLEQVETFMPYPKDVNSSLTLAEQEVLKNVDATTKTRVYREDGSYFYQSELGPNEKSLVAKMGKFYHLNSQMVVYQKINSDPEQVRLLMVNRKFEADRQIEANQMRDLSSHKLYYASLGHPAITGDFSFVKKNFDLRNLMFPDKKGLKDFDSLDKTLKQGKKRLTTLVKGLGNKTVGAQEECVKLERAIFEAVYHSEQWTDCLACATVTENLMDQIILGKPALAQLDIGDDNLKAKVLATLTQGKRDQLFLIKQLVRNLNFKQYASRIPDSPVLVDEMRLEQYQVKQENSSEKKGDLGSVLEESGTQIPARKMFEQHQKTQEELLEFDHDKLEEYKQVKQNQRMVDEYNINRPEENALEMLEYYQNMQVNSLNPAKNPMVIPLVQAQLELGVGNFHSLRIMRRAEDLHVRNISEIFELYLMRRHPKIRKVLARVGMNPDELELRFLPTDQMAFVEEMLLKARDAGLPHLEDLARLFFNLINAQPETLNLRADWSNQQKILGPRLTEDSRKLNPNFDLARKIIASPFYKEAKSSLKSCEAERFFKSIELYDKSCFNWHIFQNYNDEVVRNTYVNQFK